MIFRQSIIVMPSSLHFLAIMSDTLVMEIFFSTVLAAIILGLASLVIQILLFSVGKSRI
jgi:hypothetical protein